MRRSASVSRARWIVAFGVFFALPVVADAAAPTQRVLALLVGVSKYPTLDAGLQLNGGPRNDVLLFSEYLKSRHVPDANIRLLTDDVPGAALPTRQEIVTSLSHLVNQAQRGDTIVVLFSGHGSQQPTRDDARLEPDGLDQTFLPRDVGRWDSTDGRVRNAITDNEIGDAIDRLRARGAFVWAIFDTCHAGTLTRGESDLAQNRAVSLEQLNVPREALVEARNRTKREARVASLEAPSQLRVDSKSGTGGYVALFASQREEIAGQLRIRANGTAGASYGRFTYALVQALTSRPSATYRQVMEQVLLTFQGMGVVDATPAYEGTALDAPVFSGIDGPENPQWPVYSSEGTLIVHAGLLQRVTEDSTLSLVSSPTASPDEVIGYARVSRAGAVDASLVAIDRNNKPPVKWSAAGAAESRQAVFYARPVDLKIDFTLRVAVAGKSSRCEAPGQLLTDAIATLRRSREMAPRVEWTDAQQDADVWLCEQQGRLFLLDGAGFATIGSVWNEPPRPSASSGVVARQARTAATVARELATALDRVGRVLNLYRVAASSAGTNHLVDVTVTPCTSAPGDRCAPSISAGAAPRQIFHAGDRLDITLRNPAWAPVDVTVLYIDANHKISPVFPDPGVPQDHGRIPARSKPITISIQLDAQPPGFERLLVIAVPSRAGAAEMSFVHLAQDGAAPVDLRGASGNGLMDLMTQAAFGTATRGGSPATSDTPADFASFGWIVKRNEQ